MNSDTKAKIREALEMTLRWHSGDQWRFGNDQMRAQWQASGDQLHEALALLDAEESDDFDRALEGGEE